MILSALAALALLSGSPTTDQAGTRYALNVTVVESGVETLGARTVLVEDGAATLTIQDADGLFEINAQLTPIQGDGDADRLNFLVSVVDGDAQAFEPNLILKRGGEASIVVGQEGPDGVMFEGLKIELSPLPSSH